MHDVRSRDNGYRGEGWLVAQKGLLRSGKVLFFGLGVGY